MKNNYELVLQIIESYENEEILNDFKSKFKVGENIKKKDYMLFCIEYMDDISEMYYIKLNWKWIKKGGDDSVYDNMV
jgi:hypothetical protein